MGFVNYVESNKIKLMKPFDEIESSLPKDIDKDTVETISLQTQVLIDEVANLKLKKTSTSYTVEEVVRRIGKDAGLDWYMLYFIYPQFLEGKKMTRL